MDRIEDRRVVGVDRFDFRMERLGGFPPLAEGDAVADAGSQLVVNGQFLGRLLARPSRSDSDSGTTSLKHPPVRLGCRG